MGDINDPYFDDLPAGKASPTGAEGRGRGCFFYGCLGALLIAVVGLVLVGIVGVYLARFSSRLIDEYTATSPEPVPVVELPKAEVEAIEGRVQAFQDAAGAGQASTLVLSAQDLNALIAEDPNLRGRLAVEIEGNQLQGRLSFPLEELGLPGFLFGGLKGRYLNGSARMTPTLVSSGKLAVRIDELTVKGQPVSEEFLKALREGKAVIEFDFDEFKDKDGILRRIEAIEVRDGNLYLTAGPVRAGKSAEPSERSNEDESPETTLEAPPPAPPAPPEPPEPPGGSVLDETSARPE